MRDRLTLPPTQGEGLCHKGKSSGTGLQPVLVVGLLAITASAAVNPQTYLDDVKYLSSPELKGRGTPSPELEKAANYIAARFKSFGLKPPDGKSYEQAFTVRAAAKLGPANHLIFEDAGKKT